jgi:hypothetical protein
MTTLLGTASGASLGTATLTGVYRPVAGVRTATGALAQLVGELHAQPRPLEACAAVVPQRTAH